MVNIHTIANSLPSLTWTILGGILLTVGDLVLRSWFATHWSYGFWISFAVYMISILFVMFSFFGENIAIATLIFVVVNTVTYLGVTYFMYGDTINYKQIAGVVLGLCAMFLLKSH